VKHLPGDVRGAGAGEKQHRSDDIIRHGDAAERDGRNIFGGELAKPRVAADLGGRFAARTTTTR
jgi:hypothetical protein